MICKKTYGKIIQFIQFVTQVNDSTTSCFWQKYTLYLHMKCMQGSAAAVQFPTSRESTGRFMVRFNQWDADLITVQRPLSQDHHQPASTHTHISKERQEGLTNRMTKCIHVRAGNTGQIFTITTSKLPCCSHMFGATYLNSQ